MIFGKKEEIDKLKREIENLKKEIEEEKKKSKQYLAGWQRAKADYINREKEIERERSEWIEFANLELILKILPIYENFERLLEHYKKPAITEPQNDLEVQKFSESHWLQGLEQTQKQFEDLLKGFGLEKIKTIGEKFNSEFHEAVEKRGEGNEIVEEISAGYKMNGKVIKVAKVIIK